LHLVGYLYYWQMGFNSVFKGLRTLYHVFICISVELEVCLGLQRVIQ